MVRARDLEIVEDVVDLFYNSLLSYLLRLLVDFRLPLQVVCDGFGYHRLVEGRSVLRGDALDALPQEFVDVLQILSLSSSQSLQNLRLLVHVSLLLISLAHNVRVYTTSSWDSVVWHIHLLMLRGDSGLLSLPLGLDDGSLVGFAVSFLLLFGFFLQLSPDFSNNLPL